MTKRVYPINDKLHCGSHNIIYMIYCGKCDLQYIGETGQTFRKRFYGHKTTYNQKLTKPIPKHFNQPDHNLEDVRVILIEQIPEQNTLEESISFRKTRENFWINTLKTVTPLGLNIQKDELRILPLVLPFSKTATYVAQMAKTSFEKIQELYPKPYNQQKMVLAYSKNKSISDHLIRSKL